jgi:Na+-transporting NADH:ubiquinone oxidoreductase subunit NqrC
MKAKWTAALSALCVAAVLGAAMGAVAFGGTNTTATSTTNDQTNPLLTEEQLADLRMMAYELREIGIDNDLAMQLVDVQVEQFVAANLKSYNLTDDEVAAVMSQFDAIDNKVADIKEVAYEMRENGTTIDEIFDVIDPMLEDLQSLQDQLVVTLEGYGISLDVPHGFGIPSDFPQHPMERPEGPRPALNCSESSPLL